MSRIKHIDEVTQVSCGKYKAGSCEACPQGYGENWCEGDCKIVDGQCVPRKKSKRFFNIL